MQSETEAPPRRHGFSKWLKRDFPAKIGVCPRDDGNPEKVCFYRIDWIDAVFSPKGVEHVALLGVLGPLTSLFLGIGFLRVPNFSRWTAVLLMVAGISMVLAQNTGTDNLPVFLFFYPLATAAWLAALAPMGWRYLTDKAGPRSDQTEVAVG
jgi:hypothetical protein